MVTTPQDHKQKDFTWPLEDGSGEITLPLKMKVKILREARGKSDLDFMFIVIDGIAPPKVQAQIDEMDAGELKRMFEQWQVAWQARSGASVPQS